MNDPAANRPGPSGLRTVLSDSFPGAEFDPPLSELAAAPTPDHLVPGEHFTPLRRLVMLYEGRPVDVIAKPISPRTGSGKSRGERIWAIAHHLRAKGIGTPEPIARVWRPEAHSEEWYLTREIKGGTTFKDRLIHIFRDGQDCGVLIDLLQQVADAVRAFHEAGVFHGDLGNQNLLLLDEPGRGEASVQFLDLDRARIDLSLTHSQRGRDVSRLYLPSEFRRIFYEMLYEGPPPAEFLRWEARYRRRFDWHTQTRPFRHPLRERKRASGKSEEDYPDEKDLWIWDERSRQAITILRRKERNRSVGLLNGAQVVGVTLKALPGILSRYQTLKDKAFQAPVDLTNRVGVALHVRPDRWSNLSQYLQELGPLPVLVRAYFHAPRKEQDFLTECIRELHAQGHPVSVALVQNREAVLAPDRWRTFCRCVLEPVQGWIDGVEVGHAINRVKWGCWTGKEYRRLAEAVPGLRARYPHLEFYGPAGIDFEYHRILSALSACDRSLRFDALSHHLYVDRRGAPENEQAGFCAWQKAALARSAGSASSRCEDRLIISEVNWPLLGTGVYSPVGSPYLYPGQTVNGPSVDEATYADYMIRYFLQLLGSGMVERIYWWSLAAHGFGLIDDLDPDAWRPRPAFTALKTWLRMINHTQFTSYQQQGGRHEFTLKTPEGRERYVHYAHPEPVSPASSGWAGAESFTGERHASNSGMDVLGAQPLILDGS